MSTAPVSASCAIAGTRPPDFSKSIIMASEFDEAEHRMRCELFPSTEERQFDQEREPSDDAAGLLDELAAGHHRAAGRQQIIDQEDLGPFMDSIDVHMQLGRPIFEFILQAISAVRQLPWLAE